LGAIPALTELQIQALQQAVKDLVDAGHIGEAKNVITLLLENVDCLLLQGKR